MKTAKNQNTPKAVTRKNKSGRNAIITYPVQVPSENVIDGTLSLVENVQKVKTSCQTFGKPILNLKTGDFVFTDGMAKCRKCPVNTRQACLITANPEIKPANRTKENFIGARKSANGRHGSIKDFVGAMISQGKWTRAQIISKFAKQFPKAHASQGGRYVTSAFNKKYSIKRWGKVANKNKAGIISWK